MIRHVYSIRFEAYIYYHNKYISKQFKISNNRLPTSAGEVMRVGYAECAILVFLLLGGRHGGSDAYVRAGHLARNLVSQGLKCMCDWRWKMRLLSWVDGHTWV